MPAGSPRVNKALERLRRAWEEPSAPATVLVVLLIDQFSTEAFAWAPQTILLELHDELGVRLPDHNLSRLMAAIHILTSNEFFQDLPTFNELCVVLADGAHLPDTFVPADAAECAWGVTEALLLAPPDEDEPFSSDIRAFLGHVLEDEGILTPPDVLKIALHDPARAAQVRYDYADDPEMFAAIQHAESEKTADINRFVRERLKHLLEELQQLPLVHGQAHALTSKLLAHFPAAAPLASA